MNGWLYIAIGSLMTSFSLHTEWRHKIIWERSKRNYQKPNSRFLDYLFRPSEASYRANVFIIWPSVLLLGICCLTFGVLDILR